ncbi:MULTISPECIES: MFS transporter [unclassified Lysobacter]|uniref:MFS transporter n=1 Tax=unclassified Lysobacter TaxID=2635362 RepID=UPI0006FBF321|nr:MULTISPECIES: MFS transporter [unclassified Lysobacter]KQZ57769.1 MFS transporter [Lysobacter sp. Root559]KRA74427.1 MFS transporter [Lysobacter sp. Root667]KRC33916.1 MFS transporter [Lysobacter sp. Root76]KRD69251.1 MFS transporter [Lysobacter sp. Root96]
MSSSATSKNAIALAAVSLSALMFGLEISSVPVILPTLETLLRGDFNDMQWIMNAYTIACTTVLMAAGTLADRYGRRRILLVSLVLFGLTSLICGLAQNAPVLIVARFLQGLSAGSMLICQTAVLSHQFRPGPERSKAFAIWGIVFGIGLGFGPIIGGAIVALSNWQWVFLAHAPLSLLTVLLALAGIVESRDMQAQRLDVLGILTLSLSVLGLTYYITQGPELGYASPTGIAIVAATLAAFVAFLIVERIAPHPMFDLSVFKSREFSGALIGSVGMNFSFWPFMIYLPIYFQGALGYGAVDTGLALLAYTLPTLFVPPLAERLALRYRPGLVIPGGLFAIGVGFLLMRYGSRVEHPGWLSMLPGALIAGIGLGLTNTPVTNTATGAVSSDRAGMASGIDMSARLITLAINIALMGFILLAGIASHLRQALPDAVDAATLRAMAQRIAAGHMPSAAGASDPSSSAAIEAVGQAALVHGYGWVMLFGGVGVCVLAVLSLLVFGPVKRADLATGCTEGCAAGASVDR